MLVSELFDDMLVSDLFDDMLDDNAINERTAEVDFSYSPSPLAKRIRRSTSLSHVSTDQRQVTGSQCEVPCKSSDTDDNIDQWIFSQPETDILGKINPSAPQPSEENAISAAPAPTYKFKSLKACSATNIPVEDCDPPAGSSALMETPKVQKRKTKRRKKWVAPSPFSPLPNYASMATPDVHVSINT